MLTKKQAPIPKLTDYTEYQAAQAKKVELQTEKLSVTRERDAMQRIRATAAEQTGRSALEVAASAVLDGGTTTLIAAPTVQDIDKLNKRLRVLTRAIELQCQRIAEVRGKVSQKITASVRPEYERAVSRIAAAKKELSDAAEEEFRIRDALMENDIAFESTLPAVVPAGDRLNEYGSRANRWWDEAARDYPEVMPMGVQRRTHP
jgi:hypothetical protein